MRQYIYKVRFFTDQEEYVIAFNGEEAKILAQAKQIQKGNNYQVLSVLNVTTGNYCWDTQDGT